jgi:hypothetical protein
METLYKEVTARRELKQSFEDLARELSHLIEQTSKQERRDYLRKSLSLNTVRYENDRLDADMQKL